LATLLSEDGATRGGGATSRYRLTGIEAIQRPHCICEEGDPCADRVDPGRLLEHDDVVAHPAQPDRDTESRDTATDDDHAHNRDPPR
jgi:hypothetical protein